MLATNHVLAGALIGSAAPGPLSAYTAGVISHALMDITPHWGAEDEDGFLKVARPDGLVLLGVLAAVAATAPAGKRASMLAGALGALTPDLNKPFVHFFGRSPFPEAIDDIHIAIQNESPRRLPFEIASAVALTTAVGARILQLRRTHH